MSETKWTPGPWVVEGYDIWGPPDPRSNHTNGRMLIGGVVDGYHDWRGERTTSRSQRDEFVEATTACANLISAAPDLYTACEEALDLLRAFTDKHPVMSVLDEALRKARGDS